MFWKNSSEGRNKHFARRANSSLFRTRSAAIEPLEPRHLLDAQSFGLIGLTSYYNNPAYSRFDGTGYSIAILDTGIDHSDMALASRVVYEHDFYNDDSDASDDNGQGTAVASIVAAEAPGVNLIILKVLGSDAVGNQTHGIADIQDALDWVVANKDEFNIVAVQLSFHVGISESNIQFPDSDFPELGTLADDNVACVVMAGNKYHLSDTVSGDIHTGVLTPANDPSVISVGATFDAEGGDYTFDEPGDPTSEAYSTAPDQITPFSDRDPSLLHIFAPGADISATTLGGGTGTFSGTQIAAAHVTGVIALAQQMNEYFHGSRLSRSDLISLLQDSGVTIFDGDNEDDNNNFYTEAYYKRLDVLAMADAIAAPTVIGVTVGSTLSSSADYDVPVGSGEQLRTVPVGQANQITIHFSEDVNVSQGDLTWVSNQGNTYSIATVGGFSYNATNHTATWTFASAFAPDQIEIDLSDAVTDQAGFYTAQALDGEWTNPTALTDTGTSVWPTGEGHAGGSFAFYITILPGDATGSTGSDPPNNRVELQDLLNVKNNFGLNPATWIQGDTDGDGTVNLQDLLNVKNYFGLDFTIWPGGGGMMMARSSGEDWARIEKIRAVLDDAFGDLTPNSVVDASWLSAKLDEVIALIS